MPAARNIDVPRYRPRDARSSPLYRIIQDHLEDFCSGPKLPRDLRPSPYPCVMDGLRAFLECGIQREMIPEDEECSKKNVFCNVRPLGLSPDGSLVVIENGRKVTRGTLPDDIHKSYGNARCNFSGEIEVWDIMAI